MPRRQAAPKLPAEPAAGRGSTLSGVRAEGYGSRRRSAPTLPSDPEEARVLLLAKAEECFERFGITRTTMDDIADASRVSRPTLYRYFGDRDTLIREIAMMRAQMLKEKAHRYLDSQATLTDKLVEGLLYFAEKGRKDQFYRLLMRPENVDLANELLMDREGPGVQFMGELWEPVLTRAAAAGELREGLDLKAAYQWLTYVNFVLVGWLDLESHNVEWHRGMLRQFVVPAFVASTPAAGKGNAPGTLALPTAPSRRQPSRRS
jgi:AcrR family transcriptional regulator